jgi:heme/copper-type cytochrome/quinol oxidase subunit 2
MMTTALVVSIVASLGWLFLNWRGYRSGAKAAGWNGSTQLQMALIWVALITVLALLFGRIQP